MRVEIVDGDEPTEFVRTTGLMCFSMYRLGLVADLASDRLKAFAEACEKAGLTQETVFMGVKRYWTRCQTILNPFDR